MELIGLGNEQATNTTIMAARRPSRYNSGPAVFRKLTVPNRRYAAEGSFPKIAGDAMEVMVYLIRGGEGLELERKYPRLAREFISTFDRGVARFELGRSPAFSRRQWRRMWLIMRLPGPSRNEIKPGSLSEYQIARMRKALYDSIELLFELIRGGEGLELEKRYPKIVARFKRLVNRGFARFVQGKFPAFSKRQWDWMWRVARLPGPSRDEIRRKHRRRSRRSKRTV